MKAIALACTGSSGCSVVYWVQLHCRHAACSCVLSASQHRRRTLPANQPGRCSALLHCRAVIASPASHQRPQPGHWLRPQSTAGHTCRHQRLRRHSHAALSPASVLRLKRSGCVCTLRARTCAHIQGHACTYMYTYSHAQLATHNARTQAHAHSTCAFARLCACTVPQALGAVSRCVWAGTRCAGGWRKRSARARLSCVR